jgi:hypothetical protein
VGEKDEPTTKQERHRRSAAGDGPVPLSLPSLGLKGHSAGQASEQVLLHYIAGRGRVLTLWIPLLHYLTGALVLQRDFLKKPRHDPGDPYVLLCLQTILASR